MNAPVVNERGGYGRLISGVLFPLHERFKRHDSVERRKQLERSQWLSRDKIEAIQLDKLRVFLEAIRRNVPYYRDLLKVSDVSTIASVGDLRHLPFLTKPIIRANVDKLKSGGAQRLIRYNTGGSSGEPLVFYMGLDRVSQDVAAKWRATRWWNVDIGDRELVIWGSPIELGAQDKIRQFRDWLLRTKLLSAFAMSEKVLDAFVKDIQSFRPAMLFGYPSALDLIAKHAERRGINLSNLGIKVAFVTAERLYDTQRETIGRVFGARVANGYGGRDAGFIAHECPSGHMHITAEEIIVEIIGDDGLPAPVGQPGEIVITNTATADFPFLRYRTGDVGVLDDATCDCGRGLPVLKEIQGRTTDFLIAMDGSHVHGLAIIYVLRSLPQVQRFRITQEEVDCIRIAVVADPAIDKFQEAHIVGEVRKRMGDRMRVVVEPREFLESEQSGKFRYVVNKVGQR